MGIPTTLVASWPLPAASSGGLYSLNVLSDQGPSKAGSIFVSGAGDMKDSPAVPMIARLRGIEEMVSARRSGKVDTVDLVVAAVDSEPWTSADMPNCIESPCVAVADIAPPEATIKLQHIPTRPSKRMAMA